MFGCGEDADTDHATRIIHHPRGQKEQGGGLWRLLELDGWMDGCIFLSFEGLDYMLLKWQCLWVLRVWYLWDEVTCADYSRFYGQYEVYVNRAFCV